MTSQTFEVWDDEWAHQGDFPSLAEAQRLGQRLVMQTRLPVAIWLDDEMVADVHIDTSGNLCSRTWTDGCREDRVTLPRPIEDYRDMIAQTMITSVVTRACAELIEALLSEPDLGRRVVLAEAAMGQIAKALMESWPGGAAGFAAAAEAAA